MSIQRGLPHLFHFEIVRGFRAAGAPTVREEEEKAANDVNSATALHGEAQAVRVLYQAPPDEAC